MNELLEDLLKRFAADVGPTGLQVPTGIYSFADKRWIAGEYAAPVQIVGDDGYALIMPGWQQSLGEETEEGPNPVEIIDRITDWVMDELGHGWPELCDENGKFEALLTPDTIDGRVAWAAGGHVKAQVGELESLRIALPPW